MNSIRFQTRLRKYLKKVCIMLPICLTWLSNNALALDQVTFQLDWLPGGDKAPVYVGIEKGFFKTEDIEVEVASGRGSSDAITKIATGNADMGLSDLVALLMSKQQNQVPVSAVYSVFSKAPHAFFVLADSNIKTVADVANKKIATSPYTSSNVFLPLLLKVNQIDESNIQLVKADPGALNPMLIRGNTDVVISWVTDSVKYQEQAKQVGKTLRVLPWYDAGLEFYSTSVIASDDFLKQHPDVVKRFTKAFQKAVIYTWQHPEESGEIVHKMVPEVEAKTATDTINSIKNLVHNAVSERDGLGAITPQRLATTWRWTASAQDIKIDSFNPETAIQRQFMP